ncbi:IclR family transcriptional regulator [Virgibacillus sp. NKC19-3]|uniref:IclR family transcriptional regulator n=1 Tax=Virgibacillus saliphilus TaxID=2831674 RepID=UPI001C9A3D2C|nr:IclR family transcriptional regulator [Virgibacillus sp. NKC19-3]MBY7142827.1 IclR family transcriptional regulator [Virgibacillus sp. NKC19-3]
MTAKYNVPALEKSIAILNLIAESQGEYTITEIHKKLAISKTTVFSIIKVLEEHDIVKKNEKGEYKTGVKLYELGMSYISEVDIVKIARPYIENLMEETGYTVHLGVIDEGELLYVDKVEPNSFIRFSTYPGLRSEFHVTSLGKAIAAYLTEQELDDIIARKGLAIHTPHTITDVDEFKEALKEIRNVGHAIEDEEGEIGVRCIGVPVFNENNVVASVSIVGHSSMLSFQNAHELIERLKRVAQNISKELGSVNY